MGKGSMKHISSLEFLPLINDLWLNQWFLLTSGDFDAGHYNTMTVAWGSFGIMWQKPIATVVVRPTRYTFEFIEKYETFTLTAFDLKYKDQLKLLGTKSGRDGDKIAEAGFDIVPSEKVDAPAFKQAELIIECKKIYWDDFKPENFLDSTIEEKYPKKDYHRMYFGEILAVKGIEKYRI
jgi:flavin reductase (DIM6/NTAB) family NADH-FMN oxidoreductase RutF